MDYDVRLSGAGLEAATVGLSLGDDSLPQFLGELAEQIRGWTGTRRWRSLEDQLRIEATWGSRGHVRLRFRLQPRSYDPPCDVSVDFDVEAGAEMQSLADDVSRFYQSAFEQDS